MPDMFDALPALAAIRGAVVASPKAESVTILSLPGKGPLGTFTVTLAGGLRIRVDLNFEDGEPEMAPETASGSKEA